MRLKWSLGRSLTWLPSSLFSLFGATSLAERVQRTNFIMDLVLMRMKAMPRVGPRSPSDSQHHRVEGRRQRMILILVLALLLSRSTGQAKERLQCRTGRRGEPSLASLQYRACFKKTLLNPGLPTRHEIINCLFLALLLSSSIRTSLQVDV